MCCQKTVSVSGMKSKRMIRFICLKHDEHEKNAYLDTLGCMRVVLMEIIHLKNHN